MTNTTTFTIDCETCPARDRMCGDCFVPVLGRAWLQEPGLREQQLDSDELAAVGAFVRAGLVDQEQAARAQVELADDARWAAG